MAQALFYEGSANASLRSVILPALASDSVRIKTLFSALSRGTESLVFYGKIPKSEWETMRCPHQTGAFSFPVSYGYCLVGKVIETGSSITNLFTNDTVFVLHPHQDHLIVSGENVRKVPDIIPARRAVLAANMETALNAIWDGDLGADHRVSVVGGGVVGLLTAYVANQQTDAPVTLVDINENRRTIAESLGLRFALPAQAEANQHCVFHTSATSAGLQTALDLLGFEGQVIEMSWYGDKQTSVALGGAFHSKRLRIVSSQVGHISPNRRDTTSYAQRMAEAMALLDNSALDHLLETEIAFKALPERLSAIFSSSTPLLCQLVHYGD